MELAPHVEALVHRKTGLKIDGYFSGSKLQWLLRQQPEIRAQIASEKKLSGPAIKLTKQVATIDAGDALAPAADGPDAVSRNRNRAVVDRRPRDRQNDASAKYHGKTCPVGFRTARRFKVATWLAPGLLNR